MLTILFSVALHRPMLPYIAQCCIISPNVAYIAKRRLISPMLPYISNVALYHPMSSYIAQYFGQFKKKIPALASDYLCIRSTNSSRRQEVVCPIQHRREYCKILVIRIKRSVLRRQCTDTNQNIKRLVYCRYGK